MNYPDILPWEDPNVEAYAVLSGLRYKVGGHTVIVTTARMSPGAMQQGIVPGETAVDLGTKGKGWQSTGMEGAFPNRVFFIRDDLLITVASDLPAARLQQLAQSVEVQTGQ